MIKTLALHAHQDRYVRRARPLATPEGHGTPRLLRAYAEGGYLSATVEEWIGELPLRRVLAVLRGRSQLPVGLALHVGRSLAAIWQRFERLGTWQLLAVDPDEIRVDYAGRVRAAIEPSPGPSQHNHGAAVALIRTSFELMAPEQVRGLPPTVRTPMFTIGLLMLEALRGAPLFHRTRPFDLLQRIATERFTCALAERDDVPASVAAIIDACLADQPQGRFQTWGALMHAFDGARRDAGVFGEAELAAMVIRLFGEGYRDHAVRSDALGAFDLACTHAEVIFRTNCTL